MNLLRGKISKLYQSQQSLKLVQMHQSIEILEYAEELGSKNGSVIKKILLK